MEVYKRTEQLMFRTYDPITKYPNAEKFCLAQETKLYFLKALAYMARGNAVKSKRKEYLDNADGYIHMLKVAFRLARYRKYIGKEFHRQISIELTVIGKMLGAWIRSSSRR